MRYCQFCGAGSREASECEDVRCDMVDVIVFEKEREMATPAVDDLWQHVVDKSRVRILGIANAHSPDVKHIPTVFYVDVSGLLHSLALSDFQIDYEYVGGPEHGV